VTRAWRLLAPAALLAAGACVATSADVDSLRATINDLRVTQTRSDSARAAQIAAAGAQMGVLDDSVRALSARIAKMNGDTRGDLYAINQQLIQIQELTGQSQRRLQDLRSSLEQRQSDAQGTGAPAAAGAAGAAGAAAAAAPASPGPAELFQLSLDQLRRGSNATARNGLTMLVTQYPKSDLVPEAQFYIAESWAAEGNSAMADSAYATVVAKYPQSPRAPTALYKRALSLEKAGNKTGARAAFTQLTTAYPRSDEAALAREQLRTMN
jgi:tol-pal system protein YbgF